MTYAQKKKLDTIIAKIELLQMEVSDPSNDLAKAKTILLDALRKAGGM